MRLRKIRLLSLITIPFALVSIVAVWFMQNPGFVETYLLGRITKAVLTQTTKAGWQEKKVGSFRLRFREGDLGATKVESTLTGVREQVTGFFNEVPPETVVVVYPDLMNLEAAVKTDLPDFAIGGGIGTILAVTSPETWSAKTMATANVEQIVAHEFTHVVVNQLSGCRAPKWLNEGIAPIVAGQFTASSRAKVVTEYVNGGLYSLAEVDKYFQHPAAYPDKNAGLMYAIAASVVTYVIENHGRAKLIQVLEEINGGKTADRALETVLGKNQVALEAAWRESLQRS